jgi:hypothetical protein
VIEPYQLLSRSRSFVSPGIFPYRIHKISLNFEFGQSGLVLSSTNKAPNAKANVKYSFFNFSGGLTHPPTVKPHYFLLVTCIAARQLARLLAYHNLFQEENLS